MHYYTDMHSLEIKGADTIKFLQGQLTNDVKALNAEHPLQLTALCNQKGRIIALSYLFWVNDDHLVMMLPSNLSEHTLAQLKKYAIFSKVQFELTQNYHLGYDGNQHFISNHYGERTITTAQMNAINIENKQAMITAHNTELFLPAELDLERFDAVSFTKGCFMGQEVIARMKYKGVLKKHLCAYQLTQPYDNPEKLVDHQGETIGDIVNHCDCDGKGWVLAIVKDTYAQAAQLTLANGIIATKIA